MWQPRSAIPEAPGQCPARSNSLLVLPRTSISVSSLSRPRRQTIWKHWGYGTVWGLQECGRFEGQGRRVRALGWEWAAGNVRSRVEWCLVARAYAVCAPIRTWCRVRRVLPEDELDVAVTGQGSADFRGLFLRERAPQMSQNCTQARIIRII